MDVADISSALAAQAESVCRELLPGGRRIGSEWRVGSVNGEAGKSLSVCIRGPKAGRWSDFANGSNNGGDLLDLKEKASGCSKAEAVAWAKAFLQLSDNETRPAPSPPAPTWTPITPVPKGVGKAPVQHQTHGEPSGTYIYRDGQGDVLLGVCRYNTPKGKIFLPWTFCESVDGQRAWRQQSLPVPRPLYGLDKLAKNPGRPVLVAEGEKAADAAEKIFPGDVVTTWPAGTNATGKVDWSPLAGRQVTVWPDNDDPGKKAAQEVAAKCAEAGASEVRIVTVPENFPPKWDLGDPLPDGVTVEDIRRLKNEAKPHKTATIETLPGSGWGSPDLTVLHESRRPPPEFSSEPFGEFWGQWIEGMARMKSCPPDYVAANLLAVAGGLIGNARWASAWPGWQEPPVLWVANIGNPSSGKSPARDTVFDIVDNLQRELIPAYEQEQLAWEAEREAAKLAAENWKDEVKTAVDNGSPPPAKPERAIEPDAPVRPRLYITDATPEKLADILSQNVKGIMSARDELSGWLGNMDRYGGGSGERSLWLESFGGRPYQIDRMKKSEPTYIKHLSIPVTGGMVPDNVPSVLGTTGNDGLAARFLYIWPEAIPPRRPTNDVDIGQALNALRRLRNLRMTRDDEENLRPAIVRLDDKAADLLQQWREENARAERAASGLYLSHLGKMPGVLLRLALILEFLWWSHGEKPDPPTEIGLGAVAQAADLVDQYFKPMAERVFGDAALPVAERNAATLAKCILRERPEVVNATKIRRKWRLPGLRESSAVMAALGVLEDAAWLKPAPSREGTSPGRKKADYLVNPLALNR